MYKVIYFDHCTESKERFLNFSDENFKTEEEAKKYLNNIWGYVDLAFIIETTNLLNTYIIKL